MQGYQSRLIEATCNLFRQMRDLKVPPGGVITSTQREDLLLQAFGIADKEVLYELL